VWRDVFVSLGIADQSRLFAVQVSRIVLGACVEEAVLARRIMRGSVRDIVLRAWLIIGR